MARLDLFLVESGLIPTRSRAKRAILCGLISVNGQIIKKPAYSVKKNDEVTILNELATKPVGYWKLYAIHQLFKDPLFKDTDICLDLGSSAGGFLEYAAKNCHKVYGVEVSDEFAPRLYQLKKQYPNISVLIADAFTLDPQQNPIITQIDILLNDLTIDPPESLKILAKYLPYLKAEGYIIISIKQGKYSSKKCTQYVRTNLENLNVDILKILNIDPDKKEIHIIAQKR